jgi:hypothetical protein
MLKQFSGAHGTPAQRAYNVLCIAYGADPKLFGDFVTKGYLPKERAESVMTNTDRLLDAFEILISPHIDRALAKKVLDKKLAAREHQAGAAPACLTRANSAAVMAF